MLRRKGVAPRAGSSFSSARCSRWTLALAQLIGLSLACTPLGDLSGYSEGDGALDESVSPGPEDEAPPVDEPSGGEGELERDPTRPDRTGGESGSGASSTPEASATDVALELAEPVDGFDDPGAEAGRDESQAGEDARSTDAPTSRFRFARLVSDSEVNGLPYASAAELSVLGPDGVSLDPEGWVARADSAEAVYVGGAAAAFAIDQDPETLWHTPWFEGPPPPHPHFLEIDMQEPQVVTGFVYLPRQDRVTDGTILDFRFYVSLDGVDFGEPVASGRFEGGSEASTVILGD